MAYRYFLFIFIVFLNIDLQARCRAVLINGGADPASNFNIHTAQLREMYNSLRAQGCKEEDMHVFSASGRTDTPDFRLDPTGPNSRYISNAYQFNGSTRVPNLYASDTDTLKTEITKISKTFAPEDKVFVYVSDHGGASGDKKGLVPWYKDKKNELFTPEDLEKALSSAPQATKIKVWTECCFCGAFNKMKRANTCVASSTDEYHVGSYNWTNWGLYSAMGESASYTLSSKTYFAGQLKNGAPNTSLNSAARVSRSLTTEDIETQTGTISSGCFLGPRDSGEQYIFNSLGYANQKICLEDILKFAYRNENKVKNENCAAKNCFAELENLDREIRNYLNLELSLNYSERRRFDALRLDLKQIVDNYKSSEELKQIKQKMYLYTKLSDVEQIRRAHEYQTQVMALKLKALEKSGYKKIIGEQKLILEALFFARATPAQKKEYEKRKSCLDEALVR